MYPNDVSRYKHISELHYNKPAAPLALGHCVVLLAETYKLLSPGKAKIECPDWGFSTLTEVYLPWVRFFYPEWGFSVLYPDWGFSVLFLIFKENARVKLAKSGHGPHLFRIIVFCVVLVIVLCYCVYAVLLLLCCTVILLLCYYLCCPMYWLCVLYHCHRVLTQLQLTNISI